VRLLKDGQSLRNTAKLSGSGLSTVIRLKKLLAKQGEAPLATAA
jgi:transposase